VIPLGILRRDFFISGWGMAHYDFHQLSPHDFELLTRDLLQAE
jgi:hypothetical protein